jgi:hypothetical protein
MADNYSSPGWIAFYSLLGLVVFASSIFYFYINGYLGRSSFESGQTSIYGEFFKGFSKVLLNILPISLFTFGIVSDMINLEMRRSIPTIAAFLTLFIARIATINSANFPLFAEQSQSNSNAYWCSLPGLEFFENPVFPSSMLSTTIIAFYYIWWSIGTPKAVLISAIMLFSWASTFVQFILGDCANIYYPIMYFTGNFGILFQTTLLGLAISGFLYGLIWGVYRSLDPLVGLRIPGLPLSSSTPIIFGNASCPSGTYDDGSGNCVGPSPNPTCPVGRKWFEADSIGPAGCRCPNGTLPDSSGSCPYASNQTGVPSGGDQTFVAELYKNGQLVTDSISK